MSLPALNMEFSSSARRISAGAMALALLGVSALSAVALQYRATASQVTGLEARLVARQEVTRSAASAMGTSSVDTPELQRDAAQATSELATPWSKLLLDLEGAGADSKGAVALLGIEPDRASGRVKLIAEARTLTAALGYMRRLQSTSTLRQPLLDSHEVRRDVAEQPVRVQISADWKVRL